MSRAGEAKPQAVDRLSSFVLRHSLDIRHSTFAPVRIIHIITRLILGGAQENTLLTCEGLLRKYGDDVLLVTGPALGPEGSLIERGRGGGVPLELVPPLRRAIQPWNDLRSYRRIQRIIREFKPDVVHTHSAKAGILGRAAAAKLGVPVVVHTVHGAPFHPYQSALAREFFRRCERWAARRCDKLVCVADALAEQLIAAGVAPREKFATVYSGMEVEPFLAADASRERVRQELGYEPRHVVVGMVARLFHLKGHDGSAPGRQLIVQPPCAECAIPTGRRWKLRGRLEAAVARAGLTEHFRFLGLVPPERIPELLAAMDLVVHTSLREGLARVLPQALIVGRPVVSYDIDGAGEVVRNDDTGFLLPPRQIGPLVEAVVRLANDPALRARLGTAGRRFADQFRHDQMVEQLRQLYEQLLQSKVVAGQKSR